MENIEIFLIIGLYTLFFNHIFSKFNFFKDKKYISKHKIFVNSSLTPPFSGGLILLFTIILFLSKDNFYFSSLFFVIFLIGFFSDINVLKSPNIRFSLQVFFLIFFLNFLNISINSIRLDFVDSLLQNNYFKIFFTSFCILVLLNGTNFIDGLNTLVLGYYVLVLLSISIVSSQFSYNLFNSNEFIILFSVLIFLLILNFFELLYLGDGGAYLISIFFAIYLISISNSNLNISPYYIMNLLWYPAYENLFSIIRKICLKYSAFKPDNLHLHQIIYLTLKNKFRKTKMLNTFSGLLINSFNLLIFYLASIDYSNTKHQIFIIIFSLSLYNLIYFTLIKKINIKKLS